MREKMRALEHGLKRRKGGATHLYSMSPCCSSHVALGAGPSTGPDNAALIEQMEPTTTTAVVADDILWQPDGVTIEDWLDEEVMTLKPALSK